MYKRWGSFLLAFLLAAGLCAVPVSAAEISAEQPMQIPMSETDGNMQVPTSEADTNMQVPASEADANMQVPASEADANTQVSTPEADGAMQIPASETDGAIHSKPATAGDPTQELLDQSVEQSMLALFGVEHEVASMQDVRAVAPSGYVERGATSEIVNFIKVREGFVRFPMWDVSQWSIGYGSRCPSSPSTKVYSESSFSTTEAYEDFMHYVNEGISEEEATNLLLSFLYDTFVPAINRVAQSNNIYLTQNQFDALLDLSYQNGPAWTNGSRLRTSLINNYHNQHWSSNNDLSNCGWYVINALGTWCHVSGVANAATATRRIMDLEIFNHGLYYQSYAELKQYSPYAHYTYLFFDANGGTCIQPAETASWAASNRFYFIGSPYQSLLSAKRDGYTFLGWYTAREGGEQISESTIATLNVADPYFAGRTVYAHWGKRYNTGYTDVPDNAWYANAVVKATSQQLFEGYADQSFHPNAPLTRAMFVTVLWRLAGKPAAVTAATFADVPKDSYYANAVAWASERGITTGVSPSCFNPAANVTREQAAAFFHRYAAVGTADPLILTVFPDADQVSPFAVDDLAWAVDRGLLQGTTNNGTVLLNPKGNATRAQSAQMFLNYQSISKE